MAVWRFIAEDLLTHKRVAELPVRQFKFTEALNEAGEFSGTAHWPHGQTTELTLAPGRTAIYAERDDVIVYGGIVLGTSWTTGATEVGFAGKGFLWLLQRRLIRKQWKFINKPLMASVSSLVLDAMADHDGDFGLTVVTQGTDPNLDVQRLWAADLNNLGEVIDKLANRDQGFDYAIESYYDENGDIAKRLVLSAPRRGRRTTFVFEQGTNLLSTTVEVDASEQSRIAIATGAGQGSHKIIVPSGDTSLAGQYPLTESVTAYSEIEDTNVVAAHARALRRSLYRPRVGVSKAEVYGEPGIGSWITGDEVRVRIPEGFNVIDAWHRITSYDVAVNETGQEQITLTFAESGVFS